MRMTTIEVTEELRDRVGEHAVRGGIGHVAVHAEALGLLDRTEFFDRLRNNIARHPEIPSER